jgi:hexosaminidase
MNSMNTVHWHITDDESFPLLLTEYPNITHSTKYSENSIYTINDTTRIVEYASIRGV